MRFKKKYMVGIGIGLAIFVLDLLLFIYENDEGKFVISNWFAPMLILAVTASWSQVWLDYFIDSQKQKDVEERFSDFVRNLTGAIKSGMPVPRAITHVSNIDYGALSPYVKKLGNQIDWSVPVHKALLYFSNSTNNDIIKRCIATVIEAEQAGGNMEDVLESITSSLMEIKKIKEARRASIHAQIMQSYIIFFVFIGVMIVIQNLLVPYMLEQSKGGGALGGAMGTGTEAGVEFTKELDLNNGVAGFIISLTEWFSSLRGVFLMLAVIQGFFAGIIIGKLSEGDLMSGIKHSLFLVTAAFFVMTLISPPPLG